MTTLASRPSGKPSLPTLLLAVFFALFLSAAHADVLTVTTLADDIAAPPTGSLRKVIADAATGDTINFQAGLTGTITLAGAELLLDKNLTITGPGSAVLAISGNQASRIFRVPTGVTATISGLTMRDGKAPNGADATVPDQPEAGAPGGAIHNSGHLTLLDCAVANSSAGNGGNVYSTVHLSAGRGGHGGAIANTSGVLTLRRCAITGNKAGNGGSQSAFGGHGGGLSNIDGTILLSECTISGNIAGSSNQSYSGNGGSGGGIYFSGGSARLERSTIQQNKAGLGSGYSPLGLGGLGGGIAIAANATVEINTCTIAGNICGESAYKFDFRTQGRIPMPGAGIACQSGTLSIISSTIYGNLGSIYSSHPEFFATGTGLSIEGGTVTLSNTIIAQNKSRNVHHDLAGTLTSTGHNLIGAFDPALASGIAPNVNGDIAGTPNSPADPRLGPLTTFFGLALHPLLPGSPAIDAGDETITGTDQRGQTRPVGARVDMGSFELEYVPPPDVTVAFAKPETNVSELNGTATVTLLRAGNTASAASVQYSVSGGTATAGSDFTTSGSATFLPGETQRSITIQAIHDLEAEGNETIELSIHSPSLNASIGTTATHVVRILDDVLPGRIAFADPASAVSEPAGKALVSVVRMDGAIGEVSVAYQTASGTADASDFTPMSGVLTFAPGVMQRTIEIPIINDSVEEPGEQFTISLSAPDGGATLGSRVTQTTVILDDDSVPPASQIHAVTNKDDNALTPPPGSLRHAIAAAANGDTLHISVAGTITLAGAEILIDKDLTLTGPGADLLAISGNQASRIMRIPSGVTVFVIGLTLRDGRAANGSNAPELGGNATGGQSGGGILNAGNLALAHCILSNNRAGEGGDRTGGPSGNGGAGGDGGAIANLGGTVALVHCSAIENQAGGGGDFASTLLYNSGLGGQGGRGGAIYSSGGALELSHCAVNGNVAGKGGTGHKLAGGQSPKPGRGGNGGGVYVDGIFNLEKCCVSNNAAGDAGAGYQGSTGGAGGGIYVTSSDAVLHTSTISGNRAGKGNATGIHSSSLGGHGGGISAGGTVRVVSCTITNNIAGGIIFVPMGLGRTGSGGGISGNATLRNSIVAGNQLATAGDWIQSGTGPDVFGTIVSESHNQIGSPNPGLAPLADNGGPTQTHAFSGSSPAINAGDDSIGGTDQRGQPRHVGDHVDIGAFEAELPAISFSVGATAVQEAAGTANLTLKRNQSVEAPASVQYSTVSGTAIDGADFTGISGAITFAAGQTEGIVSIPIIQDDTLEGSETFQVTLADAAGNLLVGANATHLVTILDDEVAPTYEFASITSVISETAGKVLVTVKRQGTTNMSSAVAYVTADGTATAGSDYSHTHEAIVFAPGVSIKTIEIPILNDSIIEPDETFTIQLLGVNATHTVSIQSEDVLPSMSFEIASSTSPESNGNVLIKVRRAGPNTGAVSVTYQSASGSAETNTDFSPVNGTITFSGDITEHTIAIPIWNDNVVEGSELFTLTLSSPTNGAVLGENSTHTVTILDDDGPAAISFANADSSVSESSGEIEIIVRRTGNTSAPASVEVSANGGSAVNGSDYTFQSTTVNFSIGATEQTMALTIVNDSDEESDEGVVLTLSNPTGANLGAQTTHTVTILDDAEDLPEIRKASYHGLALSDETDVPEFGGIVVKTTDAGRLSGTFRVRGKTLRLHGRFSENRTFTQEFSPRSLGGFSGGSIHLQPDEDGAAMRGTFNFGDGSAFVIEAQRDVLGTRSNPVPDANAYTALLGTQLDGDPAGFLRAHVAPSGKVSLSAMLPDGTRLSAASHLTDDRSFPIFIPAYTKKSGYLAGPAQFVTANSLPLSGQLHWKKPPTSRPPYPAGFEDELVELSGAVYNPPRRQRILDDFDLSQGLAFLQLSGNEIPDADLSWTEQNTIRPVSPDAAQVRITLQPGTGLWNGSFRDTAGRRYKLYGICLQQDGDGEDAAVGFYLTGEGASRVEIRPENQLN